MRGHVFLLVGPSGGGKTTLIQRVTSGGRTPSFTFVPSTTSRPPRPGEADGVDYHFVAETDFATLAARGDFLEWQRVHGFRYGSSRARLVGAVDGGLWGITSADILGAFKIKAALPAVVSTVFVAPSDRNLLRQRIVARAPVPDGELRRRLGRVTMEMELAHACDRLVLNDDLDLAVERLRLCAMAEAAAAQRLRHFGRPPVVRMVEVAGPPRPECGSRFCVADCETPEQAVERVLHQWWWECRPGSVRFDLPRHTVQAAGRRECVRTADAVLDVTWWTAETAGGRPFGQALAAEG